MKQPNSWAAGISLVRDSKLQTMALSYPFGLIGVNEGYRIKSLRGEERRFHLSEQVKICTLLHITLMQMRNRHYVVQMDVSLK